MRSLLFLFAVGVVAVERPAQCVVPRPSLSAASLPQKQPTPAVKLLDVVKSTTAETAILLGLLRAAAAYISTTNGRHRLILTQITWLVVIQASSRLQGVMQEPNAVLSPDWYAKLEKPSWNPPQWAFPAAWIPLKLLQTIAAGIIWRSLDLQVAHPAVVLFLLHITLGDVWNSQFFLKQRPLTGLYVISTFWLVLVSATIAFFRQDQMAGLLLSPTVAWVAVAASLNLDIWWLNRERR